MSPNLTSPPTAARRRDQRSSPESSRAGAVDRGPGRVVDPDGKPVSGRDVRDRLARREIAHRPEATSGPDGRFVLRVPRWRRKLRTCERRERCSLGRRLGAGVRSPAGRRPSADPGALEEATIRLVEDGPPIEGRIVDLEGRPVAGVRVRVEQVWFAREGKLTDWLARAKDGGVQGPWHGLNSLPTTTAAATGSDGRFRLTGIGRDRIAELFVSGPRICHGPALRPDRDGPSVTTIDTQSMTPGPARTTYHSRQFRIRRGADEPIEGIIRDKDTARPIAGVLHARHGSSTSTARSGARRRGDDRCPGPLSIGGPGHGDGLSIIRRAGQG